jgi:hypothetical protein
MKTEDINNQVIKRGDVEREKERGEQDKRRKVKRMQYKK